MTRALEPSALEPLDTPITVRYRGRPIALTQRLVASQQVRGTTFERGVVLRPTEDATDLECVMLGADQQVLDVHHADVLPFPLPGGTVLIYGGPGHPFIPLILLKSRTVMWAEVFPPESEVSLSTTGPPDGIPKVGQVSIRLGDSAVIAGRAYAEGDYVTVGLDELIARRLTPR